jgi:hypothetical protein
VDCQVYRDGAPGGVEQGVDGEGGGRVHERDDGPAVHDSAHPRQILARLDGEDGLAASGRDELQPEQANVRNPAEHLFELRKLFSRQPLRLRPDAAHDP